jgi:BolA protein
MSLQNTMQGLLTEAFTPAFLSITDDSRKHSHGGIETHFTVCVVSEKFAGQSLLQRHRAVQGVLAAELAQMKACCLQTYTPSEWAERGGSPEPAPRCAGQG